MSVRSKLILIFLSLSVVPLAALTFFSYNNSLKSMRELVERDNQMAADQIENRVSGLNEGIQRRMEAITQLPELQRLEPGQPVSADQGAQLAQAMQREVGESWSFFSDLQFQPAKPAVAPAPPPEPVARGLPGNLEEIFEPLLALAEVEAAAASEAVAKGEKEVWSMKIILPDFSQLAMDESGGAPTVKQYQLDFVDGVPTTQTMETLTSGMVENVVRLPGFLLQTGEAGEIRLRNLGQKIRQELMHAPPEGSEQAAPRAEVIHRQVEVLRRFDAEAEEETQDLILPVMRHDRPVGNLIAHIRSDRLLAQVFQGVAVSDDEIAFAVDPRGNLHTRRPEDMETLKGLGLIAPAAADEPVRLASANYGELSRVLDQSGWIGVIEENEETGYTFGVVRRVSSELRSIRSAALMNLFLGFAFIGMAGSGVIVFSHRMTHGLQALTDGARRIAAGDLDYRILARRKDELGQLATAFNEMAADLSRSRHKLLEQERVRREMEIARTIQRDSLPREPFSSSDVQIFGRSIPCNEVGGDFYNFLPLPDGRIAILVGDVSGKGVPAALLMAEVQATMRTLLQYCQDVSQVMMQINSEVFQSKPDNVYLTLFLGILDREASTLTYVNAGHSPPFILRAEDGSVDHLGATSRPVGLFDDVSMKDACVDVASGDVLCIYTDGVAESAEAYGDEFFGAERIEAAVRSRFDADLPAMLDEVASRLT
ncbi:MAG: SpoIIE family protein phosphatase, partial [Acidobacteria bacterium]|nr:SpoIIE family protein phosphatase [Acidobacteriota bacterium]